ncbi:hypothetical protein EMIT0373P_21019 [Pseudomonas chlororaphis]
MVIRATGRCHRTAPTGVVLVNGVTSTQGRPALLLNVQSIAWLSTMSARAVTPIKPKSRYAIAWTVR